MIGGVEGGSTNSNVVIMDPEGKIRGTARGPGTNHHLLGMDECRRLLAELVNEAKQQAGIPEDTPLEALGLSLSGCEQEESNNELLEGLKLKYPNLSKRYTIGSDTEGSVAAVSNQGGVTCIAGTGSNTLLINPDGSKAQCGGWGYILGDEGSAWHLALRAVKTCFDDIDNFEPSPYPIDKIWSLIQQHFQITNQADVLAFFYSNFSKANIAALCKKIAELANNGDELSRHLFKIAGIHLAKSISSVAAKAAPELCDRPGGLHINCVGSVWLSWNLLKPGFEDYLRNNSQLKMATLLRLTTSLGVGAALMASDRLDVPMKRDYSKNYEVLYHYQRNCV